MNLKCVATGHRPMDWRLLERTEYWESSNVWAEKTVYHHIAQCVRCGLLLHKKVTT